MSKNVAINTVKGQTYIRVCESYRNEQGQPRSRTVRSYGRLDVALAKDPLFVEKLRAQVAKENQLERELKEQKLAEDAQTRIRKMEAALNRTEPDYRHMQSINIGSALIKAAWKDLNMPQLFRYLQSKAQIEYPYEETSFSLVVDRLLNLVGQRGAYENKVNHIVDCSAVGQLEVLDRVLDRLHEDKKNIVRHLNREIGKRLKRAVTAVIYDVTLGALESRQRRFSEGWPCYMGNTHPMSLLLVLDTDGIPLDYELLSGCVSELKTILPVIRRLKKAYKLEKFMVVTDGSLNTIEKLQGLIDNGCDVFFSHWIENEATTPMEGFSSEVEWQNFILADDGDVVGDQSEKGLVGICTNLKRMTPVEVKRIVRHRQTIESYFALLMSQPNPKPDLSWNEQRIDGYFVVCFVALTFEKYMVHAINQHRESLVDTDSVITAMRSATLGFDDSNPTAPIYHRLYSYGLFDEMLKLFNLEPPCRFEDKRSLGRKFRMKDFALGC